MKQSDHESDSLKHFPPGGGPSRLGFSWTYVAAPLAVLLLAVLAAVYFFNLVPPTLAFGPEAGESGSREASRGLMLSALVLLELLLALGGAVMGFIAARVFSRFLGGGVGLGSAKRVVLVMSNMVLLPQVILLYAMLDILAFNAYGHHLPSVLLVSVLLMLLGGAGIAVLFIGAFQQSRVVK